MEKERKYSKEFQPIELTNFADNEMNLVSGLYIHVMLLVIMSKGHSDTVRTVKERGSTHSQQ